MVGFPKEPLETVGVHVDLFQIIIKLLLNCILHVSVRKYVSQMKRCVDKLSKSTYPSLAPITVFVISGLQSVIY